MKWCRKSVRPTGSAAIESFRELFVTYGEHMGKLADNPVAEKV